ncbi:MAG: hypothetical protein ACRCZB_05025 [Bacteroidales bacterium]
MNDESMFDLDLQIETCDTLAFDFRGFYLVRVRNHWEIQCEYEDFDPIVVQPEDFDADGNLFFSISDEKFCFTLTDFISVETFCKDNNLF